MPVAFLAPLFLAGLAAIAVPVLVHLANRPRKQVVEFPSLMFLDRVEYRASSRRSLRHVALLALRVLALVLVAAAFARPFLDRPDAPLVALDGGREVVVLLDRSASMAVEDRMARARAAVAEVAGSLRRGDRATLVPFDHAAAAANRATDRPERLVAAADTVQPGAGGTRFAPALRLAESILSGSPLPRRELVLVPDFQRGGWDPAAAPRMPAGTEVRTVAVGAPVGNAALADVRVARDRFSGRDRVRLLARVVNRGPSPFETPVELVADGRTLAGARVRVEPGGEAAVELGPVTLGDGPMALTVRAGRDAMPLDNVHHRVVSPDRGLRVLLVESGGGPYLGRALEVGGAHRVERIAPDRLRPAELAGVDVVVLDGVDPPGDAAARALRTFAEAGRGLVTVLGDRSRAARWDGAAAGLLPGTLAGTRDPGGDGAALASLRYEHPVLRPFRDAPAGLTGARFYRYRELEPAAGAAVLARFEDGAPALVAGRVGDGRVVALTTPLDGRWSDLVLQPSFVPLLHGVVRHAAGREPVPEWRTVGELLEVGGDEPLLLAPSGTRLRPGPGSLVRLDEAGFYEVRDARSPVPPPVVAVNPDPAESALEMVDPEVVRAGIAGGAAPRRAASFAPADRERHQALWWYALAGAFLIMVAETALSNRLSRRPAAARGRGS